MYTEPSARQAQPSRSRRLLHLAAQVALVASLFGGGAPHMPASNTPPAATKPYRRRVCIAFTSFGISSLFSAAQPLRILERWPA
jgi:hypothetical protein